MAASVRRGAWRGIVRTSSERSGEPVQYRVLDKEMTRSDLHFKRIIWPLCGKQPYSTRNIESPEIS